MAFLGVLPEVPSFGQSLGRNLGQGLGQGISKSADLYTQLKLEKHKKDLRQQLINDIEGGGSGGQSQNMQQQLRGQKPQQQDIDQQFIDALPQIEQQLGRDLTPNDLNEIYPKWQQLMEGMQQQSQQMPQQHNQAQMQQAQSQKKQISERTPQEYEEMGKRAAIGGEHDLENYYLSKAKNLRKERTEERKFHTDYSKKSEEDVRALRATVPKKQIALEHARNALETGNLGYFSKDKLADITGVDAFRTAKGAQLVTAGKENLLSNMNSVAAKANNIWFEQRLNSMFPKIGQSDEANLTVQEMLEGELALDKAYLNEFDRLSKEDEETFGYPRKDIDQRARSAVEPIQDKILKRSAYRMREIYEKELGADRVKKRINEKVSKGTPLTAETARMFLDKYKNKELAISAARKLGYTIPSVDDVESYRQDQREFMSSF